MQCWLIDEPSLAHAAESKVRLSKPAKPSPRAITTRPTPGLAVVDIAGPISKYGLTEPVRGSAGTSSAALASELEALANNDAVTHVLLRIESPGGEVRGLRTAVDAVRRLADAKPVYAFIDDLGASAAYWLAVNARKVYATPGATVGSVGTYFAFLDVSEALSRAGVEVRAFSTGSLKTAGLYGTSITDEQSKYLELFVRQINAPFIGDVKRRRRLTDGQLSFVGEGGAMTADMARVSGLIDGTCSYGECVQRLLAVPAAGTRVAAPQFGELSRVRGVDTNPVYSAWDRLNDRQREQALTAEPLPLNFLDN